MPKFWREMRSKIFVMKRAMSEPKPSPVQNVISIGLSCWLWQWRKCRAMVDAAKRTGVHLEITQTFRGLRREIEGHVSGDNVDAFLHEFARRC